MATRKSSRPGSSRAAATGSSGGFTSFVLGIVVTVAVLGAILFYFGIKPASLLRRAHHATSPATATDSEDKPLPARMAPPPATAPRAPAAALADKPAPAPPFSISEDVFEAGARLYVKPTDVKPAGFSPDARFTCATCHGSPNRPGAMLEAMRPGAEQFFAPGSQATKSPSQLFLRTKYGVPGNPGMPAYASVFNDREIWQIALLLSHASEPLPDPVTQTLRAKR